MDEDRFARLLRRMEASRVASPAALVGCTAAEVEALESRYGVRLPRTYRRYLEVMGYRSGRLFTSDHVAVFYPHVLEMTGRERQRWAEDARHPVRPPPTFQLPADALLISGRLGEYFRFIRCGDEDDSAVWDFSAWEWQVREDHPSVLAWLETWCMLAENAIASGYFDRHPEGTTP